MNRRTIIMITTGFILLLTIAGGSSMSIRLVNTQQLSISENESISINYISESIKIFKSDSDKVILKEYMNRDDDYYFARISQEGGNTTIRHGKRQPILSLLRCEVEIYLPEKQYNRLSVTTVSGEIQSNVDINARSFKAGTTSGAIKSGGITADDIDIATTSGAIKVDGLNGHSNVSAVSGSIRIYDASGSGRLKTTSGLVQALYNNIDGDITMSSTSGAVKLELPTNAAFDLHASSTTGGVKADFSGQLNSGKNKVTGTVNGGGHKVKLSTISGSVKAAAR